MESSYPRGGAPSMPQASFEHNANVGLTSKGGASAELSAGGNTTVKGAMVMIN